MNRGASSDSRGPRPGVGVAILVCTCLILLGAYIHLARVATVEIAGKSYTLLQDDSYITMRYARNLAMGEGLVWNPGETPVEGSSSIGWTLVIAALYLFADDPAPLVLWLNVALHLAALFLFWLLLRRFRFPNLFVLTGLFVLAADPWLRMQVLGGAEYPLILALLAGTLLLLSRANGDRTGRGARIAAALMVGAMPLFRPELVPLVLILWACLCLAWGIGRGRPGEAAVWLGIILLPLVLATGFRLIYFGEPVPNTYYLKLTNRTTGLVQGIVEMLLYFGKYHYGLLVLPVCALLIGGDRPRWIRGLAAGLPLLLVAIVLMGEDGFRWRFMIPVIPIFLFLLFLALSSLAKRELPTGRIAGALLLIGLMGAWTYDLAVNARAGRFTESRHTPAASNIRTALLLREACTDDAVVAVFWAGAMPLYSELTCIDMLGKCDPHIARVRPFSDIHAPGHDRVDFDYVLSKRPDVVLSFVPVDLEQEALALEEPYFASVLLHNPVFQEEYELVESSLLRDFQGVYARKGTRRFDGEAWAAAEAEISRQ